jgi:hypothetical protein
MKKDPYLMKKKMEKFDQNIFKGMAIALLFIFVLNVLSLALTQQKLVEAHPEILFANLLLLIFAIEVWDCSKPFDDASLEENCVDVWNY